jgi:hypothetical protein
MFCPILSYCMGSIKVQTVEVVSFERLWPKHSKSSHESWDIGRWLPCIAQIQCYFCGQRGGDPLLSIISSKIKPLNLSPHNATYHLCILGKLLNFYASVLCNISN